MGADDESRTDTESDEERPNSGESPQELRDDRDSQDVRALLDEGSSRLTENTRLRTGDETGAWEHPAVEPDEDEAGEPVVDLDARQIRVEELTDAEVKDFETMSRPPKLPDALFQGEPDTTSIVHWHVDRDLGVVQMANEVLPGADAVHVAATTLVETSDGDCRWEIPVELIADRGVDVDVEGGLPETATFTTGEPILFRASDGMLSGETRTCYALTPASLDRLTEP